MFDALARIREFLVLRNMTEYKLSKLTGIPQSTISTWFAKSINPPVDKIELICKALDIPLDVFFSMQADDGNPEQSLDSAACSKWALLNENQKKALITTMDAMLGK